MAPPERALSLHQPWASLLVHGIKRIEGRYWTTGFRGRLWIHATVRKPDPDVVAELEALYRLIFAMEGQTEIVFPSYPQGVLVGCVDVVDCRQASDVAASPVVPDNLKLEVGPYPVCFLCDAARHLEAPIKVRGYPKFWNLPPSIATEAEAKLRPPVLVHSTFNWKTLTASL